MTRFLEITLQWNTSNIRVNKNKQTCNCLCLLFSVSWIVWRYWVIFYSNSDTTDDDYNKLVNKKSMTINSIEYTFPETLILLVTYWLNQRASSIGFVRVESTIQSQTYQWIRLLRIKFTWYFNIRDHSFSTYASFRRINISYPLICRRTRAYQWIRHVSFSENFAYVINEWSPITVTTANFKFKILKQLAVVLVENMLIQTFHSSAHLKRANRKRQHQVDTTRPHQIY